MQNFDADQSSESGEENDDQEDSAQQINDT